MIREPKFESIYQPSMKRTVKDSVFTNLFSIPKYMIALYRSLHPEDKTAEEKDIINVTIRNIITDYQYNDLGFRIGDKVLLLLEAQSTWSSNIIIRILIYLMQTYNDYFTENGTDLYSSAKVELPKPELYVIYTGRRKERPEYITLKDEFFGGQETAVDAKVKVIYDGQPGDIINQYVKFTRVADEQMKKYGRARKAAEETLRICIDENVLEEYLKERTIEVMDIMTALFDEEEIQRRYHLRIEREAKQKAMRESAESIARNMLALGTISYEDIAKCTGLSISNIEELANIQH